MVKTEPAPRFRDEDMPFLTSVFATRGSEVFVRLVRKGDRYGLNLGLLHSEEDPLVEFYLARTNNTPWFVSRYYLSTLNETRETGLCLAGNHPWEPELSLDAKAMQHILEVIGGRDGVA